MEAERARTAALTERTRIARDLHDVLAHSLGALTLQLEAAEALAASGRHDEALVRVTRSRELAGAGLREAREAVAALRDSGGSLLARTGELAEIHRRSGGSVTLTVTVDGEPWEDESADPRPMSDASQHAAVLAVQEMLTNARRYAPGRAVALALRFGGENLVVTCTNDHAGAMAGELGSGNGLRGMQERCGAVGGSALMRQMAAGRVTVCANVPLQAAAAGTAGPEAVGA